MATVWSRFRYYSEVLSLDISISVLGSAALAQRVFEAQMSFAWWIVLPLSVWSIYTADHLLDARKSGGASNNARHEFHYRHFKVLAWLTILCAAAATGLAFVFLRDLIFSAGALVAALSLMHLVLAFWGKVRFGKELSVGLIYTCGVWFAPWLNSRAEAGSLEYVIVTLFLVAAWLNLFMNSVVEFRADKKDGLLFALNVLSRQKVRRLTILVSFLAGGLALLLPLYFGASKTLLCSISAFLLLAPGLVLFFERFFLKNNRYRLLAEWAFLSGLLLKFPL